MLEEVVVDSLSAVAGVENAEGTGINFVVTLSGMSAVFHGV